MSPNVEGKKKVTQMKNAGGQPKKQVGISGGARITEVKGKRLIAGRKK